MFERHSEPAASGAETVAASAPAPRDNNYCSEKVKLKFVPLNSYLFLEKVFNTVAEQPSGSNTWIWVVIILVLLTAVALYLIGRSILCLIFVDWESQQTFE